MECIRLIGLRGVVPGRPQPCTLAQNLRLRREVEDMLGLGWSPQQIAGRLKTTYPDDQEMHVSHETIHLTLFVQARGGLKRELAHHLRTRRVTRQAKGAKPSSGKGRRNDGAVAPDASEILVIETRLDGFQGSTGTMEYLKMEVSDDTVTFDNIFINGSGEWFSSTGSIMTVEDDKIALIVWGNPDGALC